MEMKDYSNGLKPNWCPGCGDFSVLRSIQLAAAHLGLPREKMVVVTGIGCSGRLSGYMNTYGFHSVHGRSLPAAQGMKLANRELTVLAAGGDGDGFAIGTSHTVHAIRRNIDLTYVVMNNQVYGLTKGHVSPLSQSGLKTKSTPEGALDFPVQPGLLAISAGAGFYAQGFSAEQDELVDLIKAGIQHKGFSLIQVFSPCVTYNKTNTYNWFREHLISAEEAGHRDPTDFMAAINILQQTNGLLTGLIYHNPTKPCFEETHGLMDHQPLTNLNIEPSEEQFLQWTERYHMKR
ncbi:MAG: 2-oxoacid:ferredoxin oxidoreductase subunit beta [Bacillota bacterium]|nr:2-oxoacid:ferredoxin oxidoreductase subunit beta [Bacillota bacterium]MDW7678204.1 2-oxoacid:ferredoxin oxidoreductase subunit beta [Bacillota bacterium]